MKTVKIDSLIPDDKNFNLGTEEGNALIRKSIKKLGAGRSVLLDREGRIIAGNKTAAAAEAEGIEDVIVVETDGTRLVAVQRTDIDLDSKKGRELALADNVTADKNILFSHEALAPEAMRYDIDVSEWGIDNGEYKPKLTPTTAAGQVTEADLGKAAERLGSRFGGEVEEGRLVICPRCGHEFYVK